MSQENIIMQTRIEEKENLLTFELFNYHKFNIYKVIAAQVYWWIDTERLECTVVSRVSIIINYIDCNREAPLIVMNMWCRGEAFNIERVGTITLRGILQRFIADRNSSPETAWVNIEQRPRGVLSVLITEDSINSRKDSIKFST